MDLPRNYLWSGKTTNCFKRTANVVKGYQTRKMFKSAVGISVHVQFQLTAEQSMGLKEGVV